MTSFNGVSPEAAMWRYLPGRCASVGRDFEERLCAGPCAVADSVWQILDDFAFGNGDENI